MLTSEKFDHSASFLWLENVDPHKKFPKKRHFRHLYSVKRRDSVLMTHPVYINIIHYFDNPILQYDNVCIINRNLGKYCK